MKAINEEYNYRIETLNSVTWLHIYDAQKDTKQATITRTQNSEDTYTVCGVFTADFFTMLIQVSNMFGYYVNIY